MSVLAQGPEGKTAQTLFAVNVIRPLRELAVDLGDGVKLQMLQIPTGEFLMGSGDSDKDANPTEKPQHRVRISKPFYLGKYLVTREQWKAVMGSNPNRFQALTPPTPLPPPGMMPPPAAEVGGAQAASKGRTTRSKE